MPDMKSLLESMDKFAGEEVGQKPGDQVRGEEPMPRKGGYKKHPFAGRLVGGASESIDDVSEEAQSLKEEFEQYLKEYGAAGSAIGNDTGTNPQEQAAIKQQQVAQRKEAQGQIGALNAQIQNARAQLTQINRAFPQGANPVEKAMSMRDLQAQKVGLTQQIEDLTAQITQLRRYTR